MMDDASSEHADTPKYRYYDEAGVMLPAMPPACCHCAYSYVLRLAPAQRNKREGRVTACEAWLCSS